MRETKTKEIGGYTYHVTQFGARHGGRTLVRLLKMVGGAAGEAMKRDGEGFDMQTVGAMVSNLAETASEADFDFLCDTFAGASEVSGKEFPNPIPLTTEGIFDLHFAGAYLELGQWLLFAIEANFGGFLGAGGLVQKAKAAKAAATMRRVSEQAKPAASKSRSPSTSAQSGVSGA